MVLEEKTKQKPHIFSKETKKKGKFPFLASEIMGNCACPLSFHGENSHEIWIFFATQLVIISNSYHNSFLDILKRSCYIVIRFDDQIFLSVYFRYWEALEC